MHVRCSGLLRKRSSKVYSRNHLEIDCDSLFVNCKTSFGICPCLSHYLRLEIESSNRWSLAETKTWSNIFMRHEDTLKLKIFTVTLLIHSAVMYLNVWFLHSFHNLCLALKSSQLSRLTPLTVWYQERLFNRKTLCITSEGLLGVAVPRLASRAREKAPRAARNSRRSEIVINNSFMSHLLSTITLKY